MSSTEKFLDILAERDLLPEKLLANLRQQVAKAPKPIRPEALAKRLIDAGHLTPALAKRLLAALPQAEAEPEATPSDAASAQADEDDLGLVPLEDEAPKRSGPAPNAAKKPAQQPAQQPAKQAAKKSPQAPGPSAKPSTPAKQPEPSSPRSSLLDEELTPLNSEGGAPGGPLDGLLADGMDAAAAGSPLAPLPSKRGMFGWLKRRRRAPGPRRRESVWESPVLLFSGAALLGLLVLGAVLLWALGRQSGDEVLAAANDEYRAGSYTQAIHKFDQYLRRFPGHPGVSSARVKRGLAKLRQSTLEGGDWPAALATAQQVIEEIAPEDAFGEAAGELAAMLPEIAEGLAAEAQKTNDPELLAQAREAMELASNRNIVPTRLQATAKLEEVEAQLGLVERQIRQGAELDAAVAAIESALAEGDAALAYQTRHELLRTYPALADDPTLMAATRAISAAQQSAVQVAENTLAPTVEPLPDRVSASLALAERITKEPIADVDDAVFVTVVGGAAYGLSAADGRLLWQRYLGASPDGLRAPVGPVPATGTPGSDVFVVAPDRGELWRLDSQTGRPRWRLPLAEPVDVPPVPAGGQLVVATRGGWLHVVDAGSGTSVRRMQLPQPIPVAPAVDVRRGRIYQAVDHSNLFVLDLGTGRCLDVVHLGHAEGSLAAAPALAADVLLVPVNDRSRSAALQVYDLAESEVSAAPADAAPDAPPPKRLGRLLQEFRVRGQFDTSPIVAGRSIAIITDVGAAYAYDLTAAEPEEPLVPVVQRETNDTEPMARYGLFRPGQLFLADNRLTKFDVRAAEGRLVPRWVSDEQSAFLEPPQAVGGAVVHVRRRVGEPGVIVAAVDAEDGRPLWQNRIAVPPAAPPILQAAGKQVAVVDRTGAVFPVDLDALAGDGVLDQPAVAAEPGRGPIRSVVELDDGALLLSGGPGSDQIALVQPSEGPGRSTWRTLPGKLAAPPLAFRDNALLPCLPGHLLLLDPRTEEMPVEPFQPPLAPNTQLDWRLPALGDGGHVAVTDGLRTLFALAVEPEPKPHWEAVATVDLSRPVTRPLAAVGNMVFAVDDAWGLTAYELPKLEVRGQWSLEGACTWGPARVGQHVLLATEDGELLCFDDAAKLAWRVALPDTPLAGAAPLEGGQFLLATAGGTLWRVDATDGSELARVELGRPLGTAPVPVGQDVLIGGRTGNLYRIELPEGARPPSPTARERTAGQVQFVQSTQRAVPANWTCPVFPPATGESP